MRLYLGVVITIGQGCGFCICLIGHVSSFVCPNVYIFLKLHHSLGKIEDGKCHIHVQRLQLEL